jgi:hypothetical protein
MGSGKTVIALTALQDLLADGIISRVLVLAPLKVCQQVWADEHLNWAHLDGLRVQVLAGLPAAKRRLDLNAQIVVVNFDILPWLKDKGMLGLFDALLVDESTKLKSHGAWFKAIRHALPKFKWRCAMTGTPISENWEQLFYQMMLVDTGVRLGTNRDKFTRTYFYPTDFNNYNWELKPGAEAKLTAAVAPVVHEVPDYRDSLPPLHVDTVETPLPPPARAVYTDMAKGMQAKGVLAETVAVQMQKLSQIAAGFLYDGDEVIWVHDAKIEKIVSLLGGKKGSDGGGKNGSDQILSTVVVYRFVEELDRLRDRFGGRVVTLDQPGAVARWNAGDVEILAIHPASGGHGLNLAKGGHRIIFTGPIWSRDQFDQTIARLWRRGQQCPVSVTVIEAADSVDQLTSARIEEKGQLLPAFLDHLASITKN